MASVPATTGSSANDIIAALRSDVLQGTLPTVSWIVAPERCSEHPAWPAAAGAHFIDGVMRALMADPEVWASTVLFAQLRRERRILRSRAAAGAAARHARRVRARRADRSRAARADAGRFRRGAAAAACARKRSITRSVIRFLETWLGVPEPNISAWRRAICGDMTSAFDFSSSTIALPDLPGTFDPEFTAAQACARVSPQTQGTNAMPSQENGVRRRCPLPNRPDAQLTLDEGSLRIRITNTDARTAPHAPWAHFAIHVHDGKNAAPRRYDVPPGEWIEDVFPPNPDGSYEISVYGPAGFMRRFAGSIELPASDSARARPNFAQRETKNAGVRAGVFLRAVLIVLSVSSCAADVPAPATERRLARAAPAPARLRAHRCGWRACARLLPSLGVRRLRRDPWRGAPCRRAR